MPSRPRACRATQGISGNATSLQGRSIDSTTPTVNQGLVWNGSAWAPADVNALKLQNQAVSSAAPTSGQALIWNSTTSQWEPQGISGNATSLQNRPIDGTAPTSGQALVWNGSSWIPAVVDASKLQGNAVSSTTPTSGQALIWDGSQWVPRAAMLSDLAAVGSDASPQSLLVNYQQGAGLSYSDTANFKVSAGELVITDINGNNSKLRRNGTDTTVGLAASLDAGTPATNTTYYVYAVADGTGPSFTIATSTSSTQPSGKTNYRKIGWLRTALDSNQIATVGDYGLNNGSGALAAIIKPRATLSNSAAETTIFTTTVPAGTFAAGNQVNLRLWYDYTNGTGVTQTITYKVKLGSTTALTLTKNLSAYGGYIDVTVMGNGTNSQTVGLVYTDSGANNNAGLFGASRLGSATENASNALDLSVTAKFSTASTLLTLDTKGGTLLAPYWPK